MENILLRFASTILVTLLAAPALASEPGKGWEIAGPVSAEVIRIVDGDTILVAARPWPQQTVEVYVRLRGIDAPELKSGCAAIRDAGRRAQAALQQLTAERAHIRLLRIAGDKYFGRVVADIALEDGRNPAQQLLAEGYVVDYGARKHTAQSCDFWK